jgi:hypothetical protein
MQRRMQLIRVSSNDLKYKKRRIELVFLGPKLGYDSKHVGDPVNEVNIGVFKIGGEGGSEPELFGPSATHKNVVEIFLRIETAGA